MSIVDKASVIFGALLLLEAIPYALSLVFSWDLAYDITFILFMGITALIAFSYYYVVNKKFGKSKALIFFLVALILLLIIILTITVLFIALIASYN